MTTDGQTDFLPIVGGLDAKLMVEWAFSGLVVEFWVEWEIMGSNVEKCGGN